MFSEKITIICSNLLSELFVLSRSLNPCPAKPGYNSRYLNQKEYTVNPEIFARVLFSGNYAYAKFCENEILRKLRNHSVIN